MIGLKNEHYLKNCLCLDDSIELTGELEKV